MRCLKTLLMLFVYASISTFNVFSQIGENALTITVKDQFEGVINGAQISVVKTGEDKNIEAETNDFGLAQIRNLADGEYQVMVRAAGFKEYKSQNINLKKGEIKRLDIELEVAAIESKVSIGEEQSADPEKSGGAVVLGEKEIDALSSDPAELEKQIINLGEAVTGSDQLSISVNGVQGAKIPPKQQIQQIRINQNVFSAQYDNANGGGIEIFTNSNVKKYSGFLNFNFADSRFNARDPFIGRRVPYQSRNFYLYLQGPLGKKANFSISGSRNESDASAVINAVVLDSNLQPVAFKQSFAAPTRGENFSLTVNADPTKKHKISLSDYSSLTRAKGQNIGGLSLPSRANNNNFQSHYIQLSDTYLANKNVVNQTKALIFYTANNSYGGSNAAALNVLDSFFGGGAQQTTSNKNLRVDLTNETTWQMGRYALGFGGRLRGEFVDQNSTANFGGTYTFSGRIATLLDANNNPVTDNQGNFVTAQITSLESYRRTLLFGRLGYSSQRIRQLGGGANQFTISGGNPQIKASQFDFALYQQNSYKLSDTTAISFGLRYERQTNIDSDFNFAPRFGIIWAPKAKDKAKPLFTLPRISVGYGLFYTRFPLSGTVGFRQTADGGRVQYLVTDANILDAYPNVPSVAALQSFALPVTRRRLDDDFGSSYQSLVNLTVGKQVAKGYTLNFIVSRGISFRQSVTRNINAPLAGTYSVLNPAAAARPFAGAGNIYETESAGRIKSTRFSVSLNLPNKGKMFGSIRYSFIRASGNVTTGSGSPFDAYDFSREFAPTTNDGVHSVGGYFIYNLPHKISIFTDYNVNSGSRFNIYTGRDTNGDGYYSERPSFAADLNKSGLIVTKYGILDPNPSSTDRLIPRNLGRGPAVFSFNSSLTKSFDFGEDVKSKKPPKQSLSFSLNVNNVFNIINRGNPIGNMSSPNFLRSISGASSDNLIVVNGAARPNFAGRSLSFNTSFSF